MRMEPNTRKERRMYQKANYFVDTIANIWIILLLSLLFFAIVYDNFNTPSLKKPQNEVRYANHEVVQIIEIKKQDKGLN